MVWRKIILVVIFIWRSVDSKQGKFKIHMKDGNILFDDAGDMPVEMEDKGPDISSLQDSDVDMKKPDSTLEKTLKILDKTISDIGSDSENTKFSDLDASNQKEKMDELRRFLVESNLADTNGEEADWTVGSVEKASNSLYGAGAKEKQNGGYVSKVSDADMLKLRETLDKEYGKSILLIPKKDLECFIHNIKEYTLNDLVKCKDFNEYSHFEDRLRQSNPRSSVTGPMFNPPNWNRVWSPQEQPTDEKQRKANENRQLILQEFSRFLDKMNISKDSSTAQEPFNPNLLTTFNNSDIALGQASSTKIGNVDNRVNLTHQAPVPLKDVKDFLENIAEDKSPLKQSLLRWFERNSDYDTSQNRHFNLRRNVRVDRMPPPPLPSRKEKNDPRKRQQMLKPKYSQRKSRSNNLNKWKNKRKISWIPLMNDLKLSEGQSKLRGGEDWIEPDISLERSKAENRNQQSIIEKQVNEDSFVSGERHTRADFIR